MEYNTYIKLQEFDIMSSQNLGNMSMSRIFFYRNMFMYDCEHKHASVIPR